MWDKGSSGRENSTAILFSSLRKFLCAVFTATGLALVAGVDAANAAEFSALANNPRYTGLPFMHVWLAGDYGADPENYCVVQNPHTGLVYVGNREGLLEFDGVRWRLITEPGASLVRSLCVDRQGRIWGCGRLAIFRLEPDARGELHARSMHERLPVEVRAEGPALRLMAGAHGVYACSAKFLMFFGEDDGPAQTWRIAEGESAAQNLWQIGDDPYVELGPPANAVIRRHGETFERVPGLPSAVFAARVESDGTRLLATRQGIGRWNGTAFTAVQRPLGNDDALQSIFLPDGRIVIGTVNRGLVVCDGEGRILQTIGRAQGLPANQARDLAVDREGGVWVALPYGIARVQLDSPYARHGTALGREGTVNSLTLHDGALVAGTSEGVVRRGDDGRFREWPGLPGPVRELVSHDGWLFSAAPQLRGVPPGPGREPRLLDEVSSFAFLPLRGAPGWFVFGASDGLHWAHFVGDRWVSDGPLKTNTGVPTSLLESPAGVVWALIGTEGAVWRVDFRGGFSADAPARTFREPDGIPGGEGVSSIFELGGAPLALANGRLRRFDEASSHFALETRVAGVEGFPIESARVSRDGTVWLRGDAPVREVRRIPPASATSKGSATHWTAEPLPGGSLRRLLPTTFFHDVPEQTLWLAGHGALVSYDLTWRPMHPPAPPQAMVRRIETAAGQLLVAASAPAPAAPLAAFEPEQDTLRISFAVPAFAPDYEGVVHMQYRTRLEGLDREWSAWSEETERHLTNLPWRAFTFRVQARDDAGRIGPEATQAFSIRPAWWATPWAWATYGLLGLAGLAGFVRLRTQALHRRAAQLQAIIAERTRELAQSNARLAASNTELARLNRLELDEKIAAQLAEEKARLEVLRYQLNPHFLYNSLNSIYGLLFENARDAGEMVLRLSEFCRATLTGAKDELPTLGAEIGALRSYLDVEKVRWGEKLQLEFDVAAEVERVRLPPFLLLPLVENAIKYGSRTSPGVLQLKISARRVDGALLIEVANTGVWLPPDASRPDSTGIGLENLRQRLQRYYPDAHAFTTDAKAGWVIARLSLAPDKLRTGSASPMPEIVSTS